MVPRSTKNEAGQDDKPTECWDTWSDVAEEDNEFLPSDAPRHIFVMNAPITDDETIDTNTIREPRPTSDGWIESFFDKLADSIAVICGCSENCLCNGCECGCGCGRQKQALV